MSKNTNLRKVIIPCRFSYLHCFRPQSINGGESKYSICAIIPNSDIKTLSDINNAIELAKKDAISKYGNEVLDKIKNPLRCGDFDFPENEVFIGSYFINATSKDAPQVVDAKVQPIVNEEDVYSGCYGRISVTFYPYNVNGNIGIGAGLGNIQKIRDGEPLFKRANAEDEFDVIEDI